jgi:cell volume regulation protein A
VFFIVVAGAVVPGGTVAWATRRLGLESPKPPAPHALLAIESRVPLQGDLMSFYIDEALVVCGLKLDELDFPDGASVALIVRGDRLVAPKDTTRLEPGDHVYVVAQEEDRPFMQLMFGRPEED